MTEHRPIAAANTLQPYRYTRRDYQLLSENGAFDRFAKSELIDGVIVTVNAQYSRHVRVQTTLLRRLADACDSLPGDLSAWVDGSVAIDDGAMPRPDVIVTSELPESGPIPVAKVLLIIEVSDTTTNVDLITKAELYAGAGVSEYWVADVNVRVIHQMWAPVDQGYTERRETVFDDTVTSATIDGLVIETSGL